MRILVIGDSNLRDCKAYLEQDSLLQKYRYLFKYFFGKVISFKKKDFFSPEYDGYGGRRCSDLMKLVQKASTFDFVLVIVGDNDVKSQSRQDICRKFKEFQQAIWPVDVRFAGHMRRKDLNPKLVFLNNMYYRNHLGPYLKSTRLIRREDFSNSCPYHFDVYGH